MVYLIIGPSFKNVHFSFAKTDDMFTTKKLHTTSKYKDNKKTSL